MKKVLIGLIAFLFVLLLITTFYQTGYAFIPSDDQILKSDQMISEKPAYDLWGKLFSQKEAEKLMKTEEGKALLSPKNGAVKIDKKLIELGKKAFYEETFGNEVYLTDIIGAFNGPITLENIQKAVKKLNGKGTTNLQVELAETITINGKTYKKGTLVNTGLDVAKESNEILGVPLKKVDGKLKAGISCAACHATVDRETKQVIEGAVNTDLNAGLLIAMATNSASYFTHTNIKSLKNYIKNSERMVVTSNGSSAPLPNPKALEEAVDAVFIKWPKGNFDSTIDMESNPAQIPDSFTFGDFPYGWSGHAMAGPFKGLSTFNNNVHAQNSDPLTQSEISEDLFGIDKEVYLGTLLQNAANPKFRYTPDKKEKPSEFFHTVDPNPEAPGVNEAVKPPSFPKVTLAAPDGLIVSSPGYMFNEQNNAMSAWQNTLVPPKPRVKLEANAIKEGERVFNKAGCISCHAGANLTNNRIVSVNEVKTEPSRAQSLKKTEKIFGDAYLYSPDTPVPVPKDARVLKVPIDHLDPEQIKLGFAYGDSPGGYKTPALNGLYWSAPYLHDGGVAVGPDVNKHLGIPGTFEKGILPDPANSLYALVDKKLREKVISANKKAGLNDVHVSGIGHEYWVDDSTGFTKAEQESLVKYLLSIQ
ncbi:electron transport protein [Bacillus taeanensis]|uniref:Electron transport protein n=1 Tax=Bacillus taeanensis TaxID=273032 RepID=A0A366XPT9_9BACI|nr:electron transport protein [Bacillus taeanensis]RBW67917.1 electron transport protein [Bacillus taeanensis]